MDIVAARTVRKRMEKLIVNDRRTMKRFRSDCRPYKIFVCSEGGINNIVGSGRAFKSGERQQERVTLG